MTKHRIFVIFMFLVILLSLAGCSGTAQDDNTAAMVFINGVIYTVDCDSWHNEPAEAVAVCSDGFILFAGSSADAKAYIGNITEVIDLGGNVMLPGFIDSHVHAPGYMLTYLFEIYLYNSGTLEQTLTDIAAFVEANPDNDAFWGIGYSVAIGGDPRGPRAEWLDAICSERPIILTSNDEHNHWMNTIALEMNGITPETSVPQGGSIPVDPDTGLLWGTLTGGGSLITMERPLYTEAQQLEALIRFQELMHGWGYTSAMCLVPHFVDTSMYLIFYESGELALRLNLAGGLMEPGWDFDEVMGEAMAWREALDVTELLRVSSIKYFADGVVEGLTAYLLEPYDTSAGLDPGFRGEFKWDTDILIRYFDYTIANGFQIFIHTIGDAAVNTSLDILDYAQNKHPGVDMRNVLTHLQLVSDEDKIRMGQLNVIGNTQPFWHIKAPGWFEYVELITLGEERAETMYPARSLIDTGVTLTFSGDHPVTANCNPFFAIEAAVTRNLYHGGFGVDDITDIDDPKWLLNPNERVTVKDAIEAFTINGAFQLFREDEAGSIAVGKYADFIVIDRDVFKINPLEISEIQLLATVFNGRLVHGCYEKLK